VDSFEIINKAGHFESAGQQREIFDLEGLAATLSKTGS
jgi:hypothetical protein